MGKNKQPIYKIVAANSRSPRDGKFLEAVGTYNPKAAPATYKIKEDRVLYWLGVGAQPTDTVRSLLRKAGITLKIELAKRKLSPEKVEAELETWKKLKEASAGKKVTSKSKKRSKSVSAAEEKGAASEVKAE
jgi:small subunit ribosomal protein S16